MSHRVDSNGVVYDHPSGVRIGIVDRGRGGIILDEDIYRDDGRYADEPTVDVLTRVADINANIGPLVLELLADDTAERTMQTQRTRQTSWHALRRMPRPRRKRDRWRAWLRRPDPRCSSGCLCLATSAYG